MTPEHKNQLEARTNRVLRSLPELAAPRSLLPRVMASVESPAAVPAARAGWPSWPMPARVVSLVLLAGVLVAVCWLAGAAPRLGGLLPRDAQLWTASLTALGHAAHTCWDVVADMAGHINQWVAAAGLVLLVLANGCCMALAALCARLTFSPARNGLL
jgi:hypothetical protein